MRNRASSIALSLDEVEDNFRHLLPRRQFGAVQGEPDTQAGIIASSKISERVQARSEAKSTNNAITAEKPASPRNAVEVGIAISPCV
jgi:hypothetical protein